MDPNGGAANLFNSATPWIWHTNTKPPYNNHNNPWEDVEDTEHAAKEDADVQ